MLTFYSPGLSHEISQSTTFPGNLLIRLIQEGELHSKETAAENTIVSLERARRWTRSLTAHIEEIRAYHTRVRTDSSTSGLGLSPSPCCPISTPTCGSSPISTTGMIELCFMSSTIGRKQWQRSNHTISSGTRWIRRSENHTT